MLSALALIAGLSAPSQAQSVEILPHPRPPQPEIQLRCYPRITYRRYVYDNGCYYNNEVLLAVISQQRPNRVICGQIEMDCGGNRRDQPETKDQSN